jgi:mRNA-degrading endonuclease RelE of RelBE toxin-antitoxin system
MNTVIETPVYLKHTAAFWDEAERESFVTFIADNPDAGDVIPGTQGLRKVRFARAGMGKRGGVRVIYLLKNEREETLLLAAHTKTEHDTLSKAFLQALSNLYKG